MNRFNYQYRLLPIRNRPHYYMYKNEGIPSPDVLYFENLQEMRDYLLETDNVYMQAHSGKIITSYCMFSNEDVPITEDQIFTRSDFYSDKEWAKTLIN